MASKTQVCTCCGERKKLEDFYASSSPFHKHTGRLHVCKECFLKYSEDINNEINLDKLLDSLRMVDKPFLIDLLHSSIQEAKRDNKAVNGVYMKNIALPQYRNATWNDSIFEGFKKQQNNISITETDEELTDNELKELIDFFGKGFKKEDYLWLQDEYTDFLNRYECDSKSMEVLIKEICLTELDIKNRRANGEKVDTQLKTLQDLLGSSSLKPVQETGANAIDQESFGTLIKKYENERPVPKADPKWEDVDGISKYIRVFFLGHLSRMLGIKNKYENEYWDEINRYTVEEPTNNEDDNEINEEEING